MEWFNKLVEYAQSHSDGLNVLYTILGGVIVVLLFFAKPLFAYLFPKKKEEDKPQTVINITTLDINAIRDLISAAPDTSQPRIGSADDRIVLEPDTITEQQVMDAGATLSQFRAILKPAKALTPEVFPKAMRVLKYEAEKLLVIAFDSSLREKGIVAAFSIFHWTLFPGLAGSFVGQLFGENGTQFGFFIGAAIGIVNWFRLSRRGPWIKINFQKESYAVYDVASASSRSTFPEADIHTVYEENRWIAAARIAGRPVATKTSTESQADAEQEFNDFIRALNWRMGNRVSVAEGVFIEPPKHATGD